MDVKPNKLKRRRDEDQQSKAKQKKKSKESRCDVKKQEKLKQEVTVLFEAFAPSAEFDKSGIICLLRQVGSRN